MVLIWYVSKKRHYIFNIRRQLNKLSMQANINTFHCKKLHRLRLFASKTYIQFTVT